MQVHTVAASGVMQYVVPALLLTVVLGLRVRRLTQVRPLKIERLWIVPAIYFVLVAFLFTKGTPDLFGWLICFATFGLGCFAGWHRGKTMRIEVDPVTRTLSQKGSMAAVLVLLALFAVRFGMEAESHALHLKAAYIVTDALAAFALGLFSVMRVEMYLRAKRLLEETRV